MRNGVAGPTTRFLNVTRLVLFGLVTLALLAGCPSSPEGADLQAVAAALAEIGIGDFVFADGESQSGVMTDFTVPVASATEGVALTWSGSPSWLLGVAADGTVTVTQPGYLTRYTLGTLTVTASRGEASASKELSVVLTGDIEISEVLPILRPSDAQLSDGFGISVAISGDYAIVGAVYEDGGAGDPLFNSGAAYVFERIGGTWTEVTPILRASDAQADDYFGYSVAISGDYAIVGAYSEDGGAGDPLNSSGAAYVFERCGGTWTEVTPILRASDAQAGDVFGASVAISGDYAIVGAKYEDGGTGDPLDGSGAVYVFE